MSINFGNNTINNSGNSSYSFTNNGSLLLVGIAETSGSLSAISYAGNSMSKIGTTQFQSDTSNYLSFWGLINPAQGANTLAFTNSVNQQTAVLSIQGADLTTPYNGITLNNGTGTTATVSVTTTTANAYVVGFEFSANTATVGANTVSTTGSSYIGIYRSTNPVSSTSATLTVTMTSTQWQFFGIGVNQSISDGFLNFM